MLKVETFYSTMENYSGHLRQGRLLSLKGNINLAFWQQCIKQINWGLGLGDELRCYNRAEHKKHELMLKLKLQYFGHLMWRVNSLEKTLMLGGIGGQEEKGTTEDEMTQWTWVWVNSGSWWWTGRPGVLRFMGSQRVRQDWATELKSPSVLQIGSSVPFF